MRPARKTARRCGEVGGDIGRQSDKKLEVVTDHHRARELRALRAQCVGAGLSQLLRAWLDVPLVEPTTLVAAAPHCAPHETTGD